MAASRVFSSAVPTDMTLADSVGIERRLDLPGDLPGRQRLQIGRR